AVIEVDGKYVRVQGTDGTAWGWTKSSNLDDGGGSKGKTDPVTPDPGIDPVTPDPGKIDPGKVDPKLPPPTLPADDDSAAWQEIMADARSGVDVHQDFAVATLAVNPELLFAIRYGHMEHPDEFYDVLV